MWEKRGLMLFENERLRRHANQVECVILDWVPNEKMKQL